MDRWTREPAACRRVEADRRATSSGKCNVNGGDVGADEIRTPSAAEVSSDIIDERPTCEPCGAVASARDAGRKRSYVAIGMADPSQTDLDGLRAAVDVHEDQFVRLAGSPEHGHDAASPQVG